MANVQHKDLPDSQLHEPKGVAASSSSEVYVANGAASGTWRQIKETDLDLSDKSTNLYGWNHRKDALYTSGSPLAISSGVKTSFYNDGLSPLTDTTRPLGITYSTDQFVPTELNASYVVRITARITAIAAAGTPYMVKVSLEGGATPLQFAAQDIVIKGGGYVNDIALDTLFYTGALNTNQPIKIYLTPDTNIAVYDMGYLIQRTYLES